MERPVTDKAVHGPREQATTKVARRPRPGATVDRDKAATKAGVK